MRSIVGDRESCLEFGQNAHHAIVVPHGERKLGRRLLISQHQIVCILARGNIAGLVRLSNKITLFNQNN